MYKEPEMRNLMLNLTDACNLRCRYCFVQQNPHYMTFEVAKDALEMMVRINKPKGIVPRLAFFGGEPTLMWDTIIKPLVKYAEDKGYEVSWGITSNCQLVDEEKLQYMKDHKFSLLFSIDGVKEVQDYNRPRADGESSFDKLKDTIALIPYYLPNTTFRGTLIPETCHYLFDSMRFAEDQGYKNCYWMPNSWSEWDESHMRLLGSEIKKYTQYFIQCFNAGVVPILFSPITKAITDSVGYQKHIMAGTSAVKSLSKCGLGTQSGSVNYEGKLFGCQQIDSYGAVDDNLYYIGDIYNGIDVLKHKRLLDDYMNHQVKCSDPTYCDDCLLKEVCESTVCHSTSWLRYKDCNTKDKIQCYWDRLMFNEALIIDNALKNNELYQKTIWKKGRDNKQNNTCGNKCGDKNGSCSCKSDNKNKSSQNQK